MSRSATSKDYKRAYGKLITLDIETTPNLAYTFSIGKTVIPMENVLKESSLLSFSWKIYGEDQTFYEAIPLDQEDKWDDRELAIKLNRLLSKVEGVIGHNCMAVGSRVLTANLKWVPVETLKVGDKLLAFDEGRGVDAGLVRQGRRVPQIKRFLRFTEVTHTKTTKQEAFRVTMSDGSSVVVTGEHPWLVTTQASSDARWIRTRELEPGRHTPYKPFTPWDVDQSKESEYLAGMFDGEGHLALTKGADHWQLGFSQRPTKVLEAFKDYCAKLNIPISSHHKIGSPDGKVGSGRGDCVAVNVQGGKYSVMETLGRLQPVRLLEAFESKINQGRTTLNTTVIKHPVVVSVEPVGLTDIVTLSTGTHTYFGEGYAMHNCAAFDLPFITRRFFHHNLGPVPKVHIVDTLTMARETGRGLSNKLAYLTRTQEVAKSGHAKFPGMQLWMQYLAGNPEAYAEMENYNDLDIRSTEVLFDRLRPYSNVYIPGQREAAEKNDAPTCFCGSSDLQSRGFYTSRSGKYRRYRCNQCGKWLSSRLSEKGQGSVSRNVLKGGNQ